MDNGGQCKNRKHSHPTVSGNLSDLNALQWINSRQHKIEDDSSHPNSSYSNVCDDFKEENRNHI